MAAAVALGAVVGWLAAATPKGQAVRLVDVFALGPGMVYVAQQGRPSPVLAAAGAATITYNGRNYMRERSA